MYSVQVLLKSGASYEFSGKNMAYHIKDGVLNIIHYNIAGRLGSISYAPDIWACVTYNSGADGSDPV